MMKPEVRLELWIVLFAFNQFFSIYRPAIQIYNDIQASQVFFNTICDYLHIKWTFIDYRDLLLLLTGHKTWASLPGYGSNLGLKAVPWE